MVRICILSHCRDCYPAPGFPEDIEHQEHSRLKHHQESHPYHTKHLGEKWETRNKSQAGQSCKTQEFASVSTFIYKHFILSYSILSLCLHSLIHSYRVNCHAWVCGYLPGLKLWLWPVWTLDSHSNCRLALWVKLLNFAQGENLLGTFSFCIFPRARERNTLFLPPES